MCVFINRSRVLFHPLCCANSASLPDQSSAHECHPIHRGLRVHHAQWNQRRERGITHNPVSQHTQIKTHTRHEVSGSMNDEKHVDRYLDGSGEKIFTSLLTVSTDVGHLTSVGLVWRGELVWSSWLRQVRNIVTWGGSDQHAELSVRRIRIKSGEKQEKWENDKTTLITPRFTVLFSKYLNIPTSRLCAECRMRWRTT